MQTENNGKVAMADVVILHNQSEQWVSTSSSGKTFSEDRVGTTYDVKGQLRCVQLIQGIDSWRIGH